MTDHTESETETEVLIVGAGPTGLTMAIELRRRGIDCRVIERDDSSVTTSRALGIQPRTLQAFEDMGVLEAVLDEGIRATGQPVYNGERELFYLDLDAVESPYPHLWILPQNRTETILRERLEALGGEIGFERELVGFGQGSDGVTATVSHGDTDGSEEIETIRTTWLVGCDGGRSRVRKTLGLAFEGTTQDQVFLNIDADLAWDRPRDEAGVWLHEDGVFAVLPLPGERRWRLFAEITAHPERERLDADTSIETFERLLGERTGDERATILDTHWTAVFTVNQRMVDSYRRGHVFLAGDAAHVHSPVGGVGMNTGIQDAYNLAWKLALVVESAAPETLLDTYEEERLPVAADVLRATGPATTLITSTNPVVGIVRDRLLARLLDLGPLQSRILRADTQLDIDYRGSSLSGAHGKSPLLGRLGAFSRFDGALTAWRAPKTGDRVPNGDLETSTGEKTTLFEETNGETGFVLALFAGTASDAAADDLAGLAAKVEALTDGLVRSYLVLPESDSVSDHDRSNRNVTVLTDPDDELHRRYDATMSATYLFRPDGYIGFQSRPARALPIIEYLDEHLRLPVATSRPLDVGATEDPERGAVGRENRASRDGPDSLVDTPARRDRRPANG